MLRTFVGHRLGDVHGVHEFGHQRDRVHRCDHLAGVQHLTGDQPHPARLAAADQDLLHRGVGAELAAMETQTFGERGGELGHAAGLARQEFDGFGTWQQACYVIPTPVRR